MAKAEKQIYLRLVVESVSPRRTIPASELGIDRDDLPEEIRQTLSMEVLPRSELAAGRRLRKQAEDLLQQYAERTDVGWVTSRTALKELLPRLKEIRQAYRQWRDDLIQRVGQQRESLIRELESNHAGEAWLPNLRSAVERHTPGPDTLKRHVRFDVRAFEAKGVALKDLDTLDDLSDQVTDRLLEEVATTSAEVLEAVYEATNGVAPRTLARMQQLTQKVERLAFIDSRLSTLRDGLQRLGREVIDPAVAAGRRVPRDQFGEGIAALSLLQDGDEVRRRLAAGEALVWQSGATSTAAGQQAPATSSTTSAAAPDPASVAAVSDSDAGDAASSNEAPAVETVEASEDEDDEELTLPGLGLH